VPALLLRPGKAVALPALLASLLALLVFAPGAFALAAEDEYGAGFTGDGGGGGGASDGGGSGSGSGSGSSGSSGSSGGSGSSSGSGSDSGGGSGSGFDASGGGSAGSGDFDAGSGGDRGRSLGQALSDTGGAAPKPAAATVAGTRAGQAVGEDGGLSSVAWLLLALGAITAVAGGGVAVRRRQARAGY
jgi:hypothetical protein